MHKTSICKGDWSTTATNSFLPKDAATATTVASDLWSNPAIWSTESVPTAGTTVIHNQNITVYINAACYLLQTNCKSLTVSTGKILLLRGHKYEPLCTPTLPTCWLILPVPTGPK